MAKRPIGARHLRRAPHKRARGRVDLIWHKVAVAELGLAPDIEAIRGRIARRNNAEEVVRGFRVDDGRLALQQSLNDAVDDREDEVDGGEAGGCDPGPLRTISVMHVRLYIKVVCRVVKQVSAAVEVPHEQNRQQRHTKCCRD